MMPEGLKNFNYYYYKIPLYLRNSYGYTDHFAMLFDFLLRMDIVEDDLMKALDVLNDEFLTYINSLEGATNGTKSDWLDKLGALFGVTRRFSVGDGDDLTNLDLNNSEFLKLIKARIIQNNFFGTREEVLLLYKKIGLPVHLLDGETSGTARVLIDSLEPLTANEKAMFLNNLFTVQSLGISYNTAIISFAQLGIWDSPDTNKQWDKGRWGE